ncbi:phage Gp19/Gp15/Gp42 family protein [Nonomuraea sediminis]|uniref:phage Gp19/Gp15/Gp42 family protein n=1 Tax=Nonomuraea sediminis TaxID=2835864 RepID=UPI001BDCE525|nr:phage Gp19/Gp15/Gp42 family protein [Nonomuraea sediminis]
MAFATLEQFRTRFERTLALEQEPRVSALLEDASAIMSGRVPQLLTASPVPAIAVSVCYAMVARVVRNPEGKFREAYGDDYDFQRDEAQASGELELTDSEYDDLVAAVAGPAAAGRAFSIAPLYPETS